MSRLNNEDYDVPNDDLDFYFYDYPGSAKKIFVSHGFEWIDYGWISEDFESVLDQIVEKAPAIEKWTLKHTHKQLLFGLRFKTAKDKLAFTLKYI